MDNAPTELAPADITKHTLYPPALAAARWNSMDPERWAARTVREYDEHLEKVWQEFKATTPSVELAAREWQSYLLTYAAKFRAWLSARARTASPMVTGPSNFPSARNRKAIDAESRKLTDLLEWSERARRAAIKRLQPARNESAELTKLERRLEFMKAANRIVRRKVPEEQKVRELMKLEIRVSEDTAHKILEPDFAGRIGFPSYQLTSVRGKIKRLKANIVRNDNAS